MTATDDTSQASRGTEVPGGSSRRQPSSAGAAREERGALPSVPFRSLREPLGWSVTPEQAALALRGGRRSFALIGKWAGGGAILGSDPIAVADPAEDPFGVIERLPTPVAGAAGAEPDTGFVGGGWFGCLGYSLGSRIERLDSQPPTGRHLPAHSLAFYDHVVRMDADGVWWLEALETEARSAAIRRRLASLAALDVASLSRQPFTTSGWVARPGPEGHGRAVEACRERIRAGDLFQANICMRLDSTITGDPLDLFTMGAEELQPDRAAYLSGEGWTVASFSPELFLERRGASIRTAPIKGTRPRPEDPREAERSREELAGSAKDLAENRMILDMARNDLGRVCDYGSVRVECATAARPHTGVWHLVSEVKGELHESRSDRDLLRATFPPASVTGSPKIAAENVIAELESTARNVYTGAIGFASPTAGLELSVAIRTFEIRGDAAWLGLGGGIVADSDPAEEAEECRTKAAPLLRAIGARLKPRTATTPTGTPEGGDPDRRGGASERKGYASSPGDHAPPRGPGNRQGTRSGDAWDDARPPLRHGPLPVPRPDAAGGVFETIRVCDGIAERLDLHLERLAASLDEIYSAGLPAGLREEIESAAADQHGLARLRADLVPASGTESARGGGVEVRAVPAAPWDKAPVALSPVTVPGGIGPHKWRDRRLLEALEASVSPGMPLICDLDGFVLETSRANVFVVAPDGSAATPPLDGRILPGVTRRRALAEPRLLGVERPVEERPVHLSELSADAAILVTSSVALVQRAVIAGPLGAATA